MALIAEFIDKIKTAVYGEEVRDSIVGGINAVNEEVQRTTRRQKDVEHKQSELNTSQQALTDRWDLQIKNITDSNPSNVEIVDGRSSATYLKDYDTIGKRLDIIEESTTVGGINVMYPPAGLTPMQRITNAIFDNETELQRIALENTNAFNELLAYTESMKGSATLRFPAGVFPLLNGIKIRRFRNLIGIPTRTASMRHVKNGKTGTVLYDVSPVESREAFIEYKIKENVRDAIAEDMINGVINGIEFHGRFQKHNALNLCKYGIEGRITDVRFTDFLGSAMELDRCYDTNMVNCSIAYCGSGGVIESLDANGNVILDVDGNPTYITKYAIDFTSKISADNCNAWNIFGLHIEMGAYMIRFHKCRHIKIVASKFEFGSLGAYPYPWKEPCILICTGTQEITFGESVLSPPPMFNSSGQKVTWIPPYFIYIEPQDIRYANRFYQCTKIVNCDFTTPYSAMMIKCEASVIIDACKFAEVYSGTTPDGTDNIYGIYLSGPNNIISNSSITLNRHNGRCNGIYLDGGTADANTILCSTTLYDSFNKIPNEYEYGITVTNGARVGASNYYDVDYPVRVWWGNDCNIARSGRSAKIYDSTLTKMGVTDFNKAIIKMNLLGSLSDVLVFAGSTITSIYYMDNCCGGEEYTIFNVGNTDLNILHGNNTIRLTPTYDKNGTLKKSLTLKAYDSVKVKCVGTYFVEVSRNIQSANLTSKDDDIKEELLLSLNCLSSSNLTTSNTNLFKEDTSKKNLKLKSCYNASGYCFVAPYTGYFKVQIHAYCNPSISSPDYFHSITHLIHYKRVDGAPLVIKDMNLTRISTYGGMAGYVIATRVVYMEKAESFEIFAYGNNDNKYSAVYQDIQINVTGVKEIS